MIFDSFNEILDSFRPFGLQGQPYPWKTSIKSAKPRSVGEKNINTILEKARVRLHEWSKFACGYYGNTDEFIQDKPQPFVEEYLAQMKEERLSRMLANDVKFF
jgi:hypothetical protein